MSTTAPVHGSSRPGLRACDYPVGQRFKMSLGDVRGEWPQWVDVPTSGPNRHSRPVSWRVVDNTRANDRLACNGHVLVRMYRRSPLRSTLRIVCSTGLPTCLPIYSTGVLFGMMPCLTDWLGSAGSFYLKPPTGNLGTRTAIRTTVRPQLAHGRDSQSRPNLAYRRLAVLAKFRPLAARGSAQLLNLVQL